MINLENYERIQKELSPFKATLVAVSKTKPVDDIKELMSHGQKAFGENYVQEIVVKHSSIPEAEWHFIGHLQSNKVKQIIGFTSLTLSIDSIKILNEVNKQAAKANRIQECLLEIFIAKEETKTGFSMEEADELLSGEALNSLSNVRIKGLMGMATFTDDKEIIRSEFRKLRSYYERFKSPLFNVLSMGMTSDYKIALEEGSTMVRIGSAIFGER